MRAIIPRAALVAGLLGGAVATFGAGAVDADDTRSIHADVTRDAWVSAVEGETVKNTGGASQLKTKGVQEFVLLDVDPTPLAGRVVTGATLHLHCSSPKEPQRRLTVSTLASEWVEGTSPTYQHQKGSSSFQWAATDVRRWAYPGSDITAVINGEGNTLWAFADATPPHEDGWQTVAVAPQVVAARVAGISHGFVVFDDVGSEYERHGDHFTYLPFRNRFFHSKDQNKSVAPYLTVTLGAEDHEAPDAPTGIASDASELPPGEANVSWQTPADHGPAGVVGFLVRWDEGDHFDWESARPVPQYLVPRAGPAGGRVRMHLRDLGLKAGQQITLGMRAVDAAGNVSPVARAAVRVSSQPDSIDLGPAPTRAAPGAGGEAAADGGLKVSILDTLDKVQPVTGVTIPARPVAYWRANHLWSAGARQVRLSAARNEFVDFQIVLEGAAKDAKVELTFDGDAAPAAQLFRFRHVGTKLGPMPDPLVPSDGRVSIPAPDEELSGQKFAALVADVYVPHDAKPGTHAGTLKVTAGGKAQTIRVELRVWDFVLPEHLSFIPEMNCYGLPDGQEIAYYRLAQAHRACLNRLGYSWRGIPNDGCVPEGDVKGGFRWDKYDRRFGPLLDGSAFKDLPRGAIPVETFYLNLNENWPAPVEPAFKGGYWADEAFTPGYRQTFVDACGAFASHFRTKAWTGTFFEFYLNNKVYYKDHSWSRCSAPWILDEPVNTQDFDALRYYGRAFHEGIFGRGGDVKMAFRCDISRPQWQRDLLDGLLDVNVVGGAFRDYTRMVLDRKARNGELLINYGGANNIEESNVQPAAWCVETWCLGGDGVLPWQTVGDDKSWTKGDALSLFYPPGPAKLPPAAGPVASVRLKAFRRGQQDVEYLTLLQQTTGRPRWAVANAVRDALKLSGSVRREGAEDAGQVGYGSLDPAALCDLRLRVGALLDAAHPPAKTQLVEFRTPARDVSKLADRVPLAADARP